MGKRIKPCDRLVLDLSQRIIWLEAKRNGISNATALNFEKGVRTLNNVNHNDIKFFISGIGGDFFACLKIMNLINKSPSKFTIIAFGIVRSGCFFITQADGVRARLASADVKLVFHHAIDTFYPPDNKKPKPISLNQWYYEIKRHRLQLIDACQFLIFSKKGRPISKIFNLFYGEAELSAKKAISLHLLDGFFNKKEFNESRDTINKISS